MPESITFMDTTFNLTNRKEVLTAIAKATIESPVRIATVNPEFMLEAQKNEKFRRALGVMTHCTVDGSGLFFALSLYLRKKGIKPELYHGSDLVADLFEKYSDGSKKFFFLGGPVGLAETAREHISKLYPKLVVVAATDGGRVDPLKPEVSEGVAKLIKDTQPDILLVGFGAPKQELWIQAAEDLKVPVMIGVGGTLGFYGPKKRAPKLLRSLHLEWLSRMVREPGHWKRVWRAVVVFSLKSLHWMQENK